MQWLYLDPNQQQMSAEEEQLGDLVQNGAIQAETMLWNETMTEWQAARTVWPETFQAVAVPVVARPPTHGPPVIKRKGGAVTGRHARPARKKAPSSTRAVAAAASARGKIRGTEDDDDTNTATRRFAGILNQYRGWILAAAVMTMILGSVGALSGIALIVVNPHILDAVPIVLGAIPILVATFVLKAAGGVKLAVETGSPENFDNALDQLGKYFFWLGTLLLVVLLLIVVLIAIAILAPNLFILGG